MNEIKKENGDLYGFGSNGYGMFLFHQISKNKKKNKGQLGAGDFDYYGEVKLIRNDKTIKSICTGKNHSFIYHRNKKKKKK